MINLDIQKGEYVIGRPIPHILQVMEADPVTGLLSAWVVGPKVSREREVKDVKAYHMIGFDGVAELYPKEIDSRLVGCGVTLLPGCCMMNLNHTGFVNMALQKSYGLQQIRIEDIHILAGIDG